MIYITYTADMNLHDIMDWYHSSSGQTIAELASTRDIFQARLDGFLRVLLRKFGHNDDAMLLVAVIGELGNNCFDHNMGQWRDLSGCVFVSEILEDKIKIVVADHGQGIFSSLRRVDASIQDAQEALKIAFSKILSGRFPENRGNGLKFVRQSINGHDKRGLCCLSNGDEFYCGTKGSDLLQEVKGFNKNPSNPKWGTLTMLEWEAS